MATQRWKCVDTCYQYGKRFKKGVEFPPAWLDAGYIPNPPGKTWFVPVEEYDDYLRSETAQQGKILTAGQDPRPTNVLIEELEKAMGKVPKTWTRARIWGALMGRELAEAKSDAGPRKPGRPPTSAPKE